MPSICAGSTQPPRANARCAGEGTTRRAAVSPRIAELLRSRGHDVHAVGKRVDLTGGSDRLILEVAASEGRVVITTNVKDFRPFAAERLTRGESLAGLILLPSKRTRTRAVSSCSPTRASGSSTHIRGGVESAECWIPPLEDR
jgi:hypothetical protein